MAQWYWPVSNHGIGTGYGVAGSQWSSGNHTGVDFEAGGGAPVQAASGGRVVLARSESYGSPYGNYVIVDHGGGVYTLYAHLAGFNVKVGQRLNAGQHIGRVGSTGHSSGPHLHFEVRKGDWMQPESAVNPFKFMQGRVDGGGGGGAGRVGDGGKGNKGNNSDYGFNPEFLRNHPEIKALVNRAQNQDWSDSKFTQELRDTKWWESTTKTVRAWQLLSTEQPAEAKEQIENRQVDLKAQASMMGVDLSKKELKELAEKALRTGMTDQEVLGFIARQFDLPGRRSEDPVVGTAGDTITSLETLAYSYGVPVDRKRLERQVRRVLSGKMTVDGLRDYYVEQAKGLYPTLDKELDRGRTVEEMMAAYASIAQEELGITEDDINLTKPQWTKALTGGANGRMSMDEWLETLRTDAKYGYDMTDRAREQASGLASMLKQALGNGAI